MSSLKIGIGITEARIEAGDLNPGLGCLIQGQRRFLCQHRPDIGAECNLFVGQFRRNEFGFTRLLFGTSQIDRLLLLVGDLLNDLLLLVDDLQRIGVGVVSVRHQVGKCQHRADQDFFIILAGIRLSVVIRQHGSGEFADFLLFEIVKSVANAAQYLFRFFRPAGSEFNHRLIEQEDVRFTLMMFQLLLDRVTCQIEATRVIFLAYNPDTVIM